MTAISGALLLLEHRRCPIFYLFGDKQPVLVTTHGAACMGNYHGYHSLYISMISAIENCGVTGKITFSVGCIAKCALRRSNLEVWLGSLRYTWKCWRRRRIIPKCFYHINRAFIPLEIGKEYAMAGSFEKFNKAVWKLAMH